MNMAQDNEERRAIMDKISFEDFKKIMSYDITKNETCIEIEFGVDNCETYKNSWLGKMIDRETNKADG